MKSDNFRSSPAASRDKSRNMASVIQTLTHSVFLSDSDIKKAPLVGGRIAGEGGNRRLGEIYSKQLEILLSGPAPHIAAMANRNKLIRLGVIPVIVSCGVDTTVRALLAAPRFRKPRLYQGVRKPASSTPNERIRLKFLRA